MNLSTRKLAYTALMAVVLCICSWITVPFAVPFTMQTFAVFCSLLLLGGKLGTLSIGVYILLGMAGLPVFSGFRGGIGHIIGPTGGYIVGFLFSGLFYILCEPLLEKNGKLKIPVLAGGLLLCYLVGTMWFKVVTGTGGAEYGFWKILSICVFPFLLPDALKLILAVFVSNRVGKILKRKDK